MSIEGKVLLGFGDFFTSVSAVGAAKPAAPAKPTAKAPLTPKTKKGGKASFVPASRDASPHKAAIVSVINASKLALDAAKKGTAQASKHASDVKAGKHAPIVPVKVVAVGGDGQVILGAALKPGKKPLTPKQQLAVSKHAKAIAKNVAAHKRLAAAAKVAKEVGEKAAGFAKTATPFLKKALAGTAQPTKVHIGGGISPGMLRMPTLDDGLMTPYTDDGLMTPYVGDEVGLAEECLGLIDEMLGDAAPVDPNAPPAPVDPNAPQAQPDPNNPGYLTDGNPDPNAPAGSDGSQGGIDANTGVVTDINGKVLYDPAAPDPDIVPMPVRGQQITQADAQMWHKTVPADGIVLSIGPLPGLPPSTSMAPYVAGSVLLMHPLPPPRPPVVLPPFPEYSVGTYSWFADGTWPVSSGAGGNKTGFIYTKRGTHYGRDQDQPRWMGQRNEDQVNDIDDNDLAGKYSMDALVAAAQQLSANGVVFGPLIGNPDPAGPAGGMYSGLQYAVDDKKWFWQGKYAPASATQDMDNAIAQANLATIAAKTKAASVIAAKTAADKAAADEAQAKQDAAAALAQQAAQAEQQVAQTKADTADITAQQAQGAQQAQADIDYQKMQDTQQAQQAAADIQAYQAQIPIAAAQDQLSVQQGQQQLAAQAAAQTQLVQEADVYNQWAKTNPAAAVAQMQQGGYLPSGGMMPDDGSAPDDGSQQMGPSQGGDDAFDDGGESMGPTSDALDGEAPPMFEEKMLPTDDEEPAAAWPFDNDQANMLGDIDRMLGQDVD